MTTPVEFTYPKYLRAKRTVDARALNHRVWTQFIRMLVARGPSVRLLEGGAGVGTTARSILEALATTAVGKITYTLVDVNLDNLSVARKRLHSWLREQEGSRRGEGAAYQYNDLEIDLRFVQADCLDFAEEETGASYDAVVAQALLDLLPVEKALATLRPLLREGGLWYLPIHFDGVTAFEPALDAELDAKIARLYHESMANNIDEEGGADGAHTGRRLLSRLRQVGATLVEAGSSDWVVFAREDGYPKEEAYFLHHILHFIEEELSDHPDVDVGRLAEWVRRRRRQIETNELVYIAHQLDALAVQK